MAVREFAVLLSLAVLAGAPGAQDVRVQSCSLDAEFRPAEAWVGARAKLRLETSSPAPEEATFYLHGELSVSSLKLGDDDVAFEQERVLYAANYSMLATRVTLPLSGHDLDRDLTVVYEGYFHPSKARSASDYMRIDADAVLLRSFPYSLWFPVFLEPDGDGYPVDFPSVVLRTPEAFLSVFAGERTAERVEDGQRITEWRAAGLDLFAAQCSAQRWVLERRGPYHVYSLPDEASRERAAAILAFTSKLDGVCRRRYRPSASADQIHVLQMPRYGDISSGNVLGLSTEAWNAFDPGTYAGLTLAHEFVHPFVWVPTPKADPLYAFVVEGFPGYFHWPALAELLGDDVYERALDRAQASYLQRRESGHDRWNRALPPEKPLTRFTADDVGVYKDRFVLNDRALLCLDYYRRRMGSGFDAFVRELFELERMDRTSLERVIEAHLEGGSASLATWLDTTEFPADLRRPSPGR